MGVICELEIKKLIQSLADCLFELDTMAVIFTTLIFIKETFLFRVWHMLPYLIYTVKSESFLLHPVAQGD